MNNTLNPVEAAQARIDGLLNSMVDGGDVTAKQLAEARAELELAGMRDEAERRRKNSQAAEGRREALLGLQERLQTDFDAKAVVACQERLANAIEAYVSMAAENNRGLHAMRSELQAGGFVKGYTPGPVDGIEASDGTTVRIGDVVAHNLRPKEVVESLVAEILSRHFPRGAG